MKISHLKLQESQEYAYTAVFMDGTHAVVKLKTPTATKADLEPMFPKPISRVYGGDITKTGGEQPGDAQNRAEYHKQQDDLEKGVAKQPWQTKQFPFEDAVHEEVYDLYKSQLNELSVQQLKTYATKAKQVDPHADRFKTVKHTDGYHKASARIAHKTGDRTGRPQEESLEERLAQFVGEAPDAMGFTGALNKQHADQQVSKKLPVKEIPYHGWTIRYRPASSPAEKVIWQVMDKKGEVKHKGEATAETNAVRDAQEWINAGGGTTGQATDKVTIDFNAAFTKEFASEGETFYATFTADGNTPVLIISTVPQSGMKTSHPKPVKNGIGTPVISLSPKESNEAKLQPNGRYVLGPKDAIDENTMMFPLIFQSITQNTNDKVRMSQPGITVASTRAH